MQKSLIYNRLLKASEDLCQNSATSSIAMFYIVSLIAMLSGTLSLSSHPLTRFPIGRSLCEKFCVNIKGCNVVSYLPEKLMCVIGNRHQEGYIVFHINKSNTDYGLCGTDSSFQGIYLVSRSGQSICVKTYSSGVRDKGSGHLLVVSTNRSALLVNLETMTTKQYPYELSLGVIDIAYMPWTNSLVLVLKYQRTLIVPVGKEGVSNFLRVSSYRCAVDGEKEIVFLATLIGRIVKVIDGKDPVNIAHLYQGPHAFGVDARLKMVLVSLGKIIIRMTYSGEKRETLITFEHNVYSLSMNENSNALYGLTTRRIFILNLSDNTTAYVPTLPGTMKSIDVVNSKVFIVSGSFILSVENGTQKIIGEMPYRKTRSFSTCVLP